MRSPTRPAWWALASSAGAVAALVGGWAVAGAVQGPDYDPVRLTISALARHGAEHRWVMTAALFAVGGCHLITAAGLRGARRGSRLLLAAAGVAGLGLGAFAQPAHGSTNVHLAFASLGLATLAIWPLTVVSRSRTRFPLRRRDAVFSAGLSLVLLAWMAQAVGGTTLGLAERATTFQQQLWPLLVVVALRRPKRVCEVRAWAICSARCDGASKLDRRPADALIRFSLAVTAGRPESDDSRGKPDQRRRKLSGTCCSARCERAYARPDRAEQTSWEDALVTEAAHSAAARRRDVVLLGSTGSIGTQTVDVVTRAPDRFQVSAIAAGGGNLRVLAEQAARLRVAAVGISRESAVDELHAELEAVWPGDVPYPRLYPGPHATEELAQRGCDVVLNAVAGAQGLRATLAALDAGRVVALANKESLIAGGPLVTARARPGQLVPVDSEHSALAQCLRSGRAQEVRRLLVTASGGPFRGRRRDELHAVTPEQALAHPTWNMGRLVTTNSATLVNKGLEVIEAHLLFDVPLERIDVVVHPQSVIHSMVEFVDGSTIAQASPPDMRLPISLALGWPDRVDDAAAPVDWTRANTWTFEPLDTAAFPAVGLAREAGAAGGCAPAVYNAANEELVDAFHAGAVSFLQIVDTVAEVLHAWLSERHGQGGSGGNPGTVEDVEEAESWARERARAVAATPAPH